LRLHSHLPACLCAIRFYLDITPHASAVAARARHHGRAATYALLAAVQRSGTTRWQHRERGNCGSNAAAWRWLQAQDAHTGTRNKRGALVWQRRRRRDRASMAARVHR